MFSKPRPALVGAFVIFCVFLVLVGIALWGSGRLFSKSYKYVCYFPASVNGLSVGSPVKYRGVPIGRVDAMLIPYSRMASTDARVAVVIELASRQVRKRGGEVDPAPAVVGGLVDRGLRAQLESESFITGQLYVSLDVIPNAPKVEPSTGRRGLPEIPTIPSQTEQLRQAVARVGEQLSQADLPRFVTSATATFESAHRLLDSVDAKTLVNELARTSAAIRRLANNVNTQVGPMRDAVQDADSSLASVIGDLHATLAPNSPMLVELSRTLVEMQRAARSISAFADMLERNPNALVAGKK